MPPVRLPFCKAHALGNDFLLVEIAQLEGCDPGALALRLCDRHTGIGADGLVVLGPPDRAHTSFGIFNGDGSEAGLSGNALRCAAAWLHQRDPARPEHVAFETRVGRRELFFVRQDGTAQVFRAEIGRPSFAAGDVPFRPPRPPAEPIISYPLPVSDSTIPATILSMGNPQCIIFLEDVPALDWLSLGADIERHPFFPDRANVGFIRVAGQDRIEARFWERGAGHTLASGTGSCACAVAAHLAGKTGRRVVVQVERGEMEVRWRDDGFVELTGPAEIVAEGTCFL